MSDYRLVDVTVDETVGALLEDVDRIGVDTEFMRERTYFAELCLLQVSTGAGIVCADPLGNGPRDGSPLQAFWRAMQRPEWVVHSARQDIEVFYQTSGLMPAAIFDTQVAAGLIGFQPQIGYAGLVSELFGVELDKTHTRANWSKRPLSPALLRYAAEDVQYLLPAYEELGGRLEKLGRLAWAVEDSLAVLDPGLYETDPSLAIQRLKGARDLHGRARAAAAALAAWRESEAIRSNRPRQWIMRDPVLIEIAIRAPRSARELAGIEGIAEKTLRRAGDRLLTIIGEATEDRSGYEPPKRPDERQKSALKAMQAETKNVADELGIAAELLAPRKELSSLMLGDRESRVVNGWRRELIGERLLALLQGGA